MYFVTSDDLHWLSFFQVLNRSTEPHSSGKPGHNQANSGSGSPAQPPLMPCLPPTLAPMSPMTVIPQQMITAGTRKDCIRLRGLPYEAQVEHILEFLGDHAKNIVYQGVHMVFNAQVFPVIFLEIVRHFSLLFSWINLNKFLHQKWKNVMMVYPVIFLNFT